MGVVRRQGVKDSMVSYIGVGIGAVSTLVIYPAYLKPEELGLFQFIVGNALMIAPLILLGGTNLAVRYFPSFKDDQSGHHGFLGLLLLLVGIGFGVVVLVYALIKPQLLSFFSLKDPLLSKYLNLIVLLAFVLACNQLLNSYTKNFLRIVVPNILENIWVKLATPTLSVLLFVKVLNLDQFVVGIVMAYVVVALGNVLYLKYLKAWHLRIDWSFLNPGLAKEMTVYGMYGILGTLGASMMTWLDKFMIPLLIDDEGLAALGIYTIVAYIGLVIDVPRRSLERITAPLVSQAMNRQDLEEVRTLYLKTALNQFVIGTFILLGIWSSIDSLFTLMPNGDLYLPHKSIVLILGSATLFDMITGNNSQIIFFSRYFRFNLVLLVLLAALNIAFNILFIKYFGMKIEGAALATLVSILIFNTVKFWFIYQKWGMHPFRWKMLSVLAFAWLIYLLVSWLPMPISPIATILIRSSLITVIFWSIAKVLDWSPDLSDLIILAWNRIKGRAK